MKPGGMRFSVISSSSVLQSPVDVPSVLDPQDFHRSRLVVNVVEHPDLTNSHSPGPGTQLHTPFGSWVVG